MLDRDTHTNGNLRFQYTRNRYLCTITTIDKKTPLAFTCNSDAPEKRLDLNVRLIVQLVSVVDIDRIKTFACK